MITTDIRETHRCQRCGSRLESSGVRETCLRCALDAVLRDENSTEPCEPATSSESASRLRRFGDYDLLAEVARGGMGVVYRARHVGLDREVALKMVLFGQFADPQTLDRFHAEARTGARLKHPHIVAIHDLGTLDGRPWFTMDLINGPNLSDAFRIGVPAPREAAQLVLTIVEAIAYAHGQGVLHRDLKPSNILLDSEGRPHVTDFGLARLIATNSNLTQTGQALGSPNYMAPEQAAGTRETGASADIWSLGAILHFLLTGRPPFAGASVADTLRAVREDEPVSPRQLNARIPADLETICLKCLQKEQGRRYATAEELADDLSRFLRDEPILARPIGPTTRLWRWCQRKPLVAFLVLALHLAFALGLAGVLWQWHRAELSAINEARLRGRAEADELSARELQYFSEMNLVQQAWQDGNIKQAQALLRSHIPNDSQSDLRGFEWRYLWGLCQDQSRLSFTNFTDLVEFAVSPDGAYAAVCSGQVINLFDLVNYRVVDRLVDPGAAVFTAAAFSPKTPNIVATAATDGIIKLWNLSNKELITSPFWAASNAITHLAFSPDGKLLASTEGITLSLWDLESRTRLWRRNGAWEAHGPITCAASVRHEVVFETAWRDWNPDQVLRVAAGILRKQASDGRPRNIPGLLPEV